jgi:hypothetical protein
MKRWAGVVVIVLVYLAGVNLAWSAAQIRVWNYFDWVDIIVMALLVAPFLSTRWVWPSTIRATRMAWVVAAIMAVDIPVHIMTKFSTGSGHPSLESLVLYSSALARVALVPAALAALCVAHAKRERAIVIALGVICLVGVSVYMVPGPEHPIRWLLIRHWTEGAGA